jgi:hypothetical protein
MMISGTEIETVDIKLVEDDDGKIVRGTDDGYDHVPRIF